VTDLAPELTVDQVLSEFKSFPAWVWCNRPTRDFLIWLKEHNLALPPNKRCGIFGLDLYSLQTSMNTIIPYLNANDPPAAANVKDTLTTLGSHLRAIFRILNFREDAVMH
jgi:erythromycin esterase-like protein